MGPAVTVNQIEQFAAGVNYSVAPGVTEPEPCSCSSYSRPGAGQVTVWGLQSHSFFRVCALSFVSICYEALGSSLSLPVPIFPAVIGNNGTEKFKLNGDSAHRRFWQRASFQLLAAALCRRHCWPALIDMPARLCLI